LYELVLALALLGGLIGAAALITLTPWWWLFGAGLISMALGLLVGVPAGVWYHVRLYRLLRPTGRLSRTWWLRPTGLHDALDAAQQKRIRVPFYLGALGFVIAIVGCVLFAIGAWRS
jgi:hypothetical protein